MFRDRPLTWLFVAANVCIDLVLITISRAEGGAGAFVAIWSLALLVVVIPVQLLLVVSSICTSETQSSVKAGWVTVSLLLAIAVAWYCTYKPAEDLDDYVMLYGSEVLLTGLCFFTAQKIGLLRPFGADCSRRFQFSLMDLIAWTTVVAIWAAGYRFLNELDVDIREAMVFVPCLGVLAVATAILLNWRTTWWRRWAALLLTVASLAVLPIALTKGLRSDNFPYIAGTLFLIQLYLVFWDNIKKMETPESPEERVKALRSTLP